MKQGDVTNMSHDDPKWMINEYGDPKPVCPYCDVPYRDAAIFDVKHYPADGGASMFLECEDCNEEAKINFDWVNIKVAKILNDMGKEALKINVERGFTPANWEDPIRLASKLALIHSEISESLEEVRKGTVEAFGEELIDILIRTLELGSSLEIDMDKVFKEKMDKNRKREWRHGDKRL
jgi:NTP pyrophosphatase (non-canonical NTP hydrolase)